MPDPTRQHVATLSKASPEMSGDGIITWQGDLSFLLKEAKRYFGDVCWVDENGDEIWAHKAIIFARSGGVFQSRYLGAQQDVQRAASTSLLSLASRPASGMSASPLTSPLSPVPRLRLSLSGTDGAFFRSMLDFLYTSQSLQALFEFLFEDHSGLTDEERRARLQQDLLYMWRSKLFSDVKIQLAFQPDLPMEYDHPEPAEPETFDTHRFVLCSRCPYFKTLLLEDYRDSNSPVLTLPSPPFTPASTHFTLGYLYCGTLDCSNRSFDLSTAMQIWRSAQFLSLPLLRDQIESRIADMCHNFRCTCIKCARRVPRVYEFALAPDVQSLSLKLMAQILVVKEFGSMWSSEVGNLDYLAQKELVDEVCRNTTPDTAIDNLKALLLLRRRIENERSDWADHVRSMLEPIDARICQVLQKDLAGLIASKSFTALIEGVGFSSDVLEKLLARLIDHLSETCAPQAYQLLVGSVLLQEGAEMSMDARVLIEDAKNGVLKYLKHSWMNVRSANAFESLENWALKEISDEIEVSVDDLLLPVEPKPKAISPKASKQQVPRTTPTSTANGAIRGRAPPAGRGRSPQVGRATAGTNGPTRTTIGSSTAAATSFASVSAAGRAVPAAAAGRSGGATSLSTPASPRSRTVSGTSTATVRTQRSSSALKGSETPGNVTSKSIRPPPPVPSAPSTLLKPPPSPLPTQEGAKNRSSSVTSTASQSLTGPRAKPAKNSDSPGSQTDDRKSTLSIRSLASATSTRSASQGRAHKGDGSRGTVAAPLHPKNTLKPPPLPTHKKVVPNRTPSRPESVTSVRTTTSVRSSAPRVKVTSSNGSRLLQKNESTQSVRSVSQASAFQKPASKAVGPSFADPGEPHEPHGTSLEIGIPCIVSLNGGGMKLKAKVKYIGERIGLEGVWIGLEVDHHDIQDSLSGMDWNDGSVGDVRYFHMEKGQDQETDILNGPLGLFVTPPQIIFVFDDADK